MRFWAIPRRLQFSLRHAINGITTYDLTMIRHIQNIRTGLWALWGFFLTAWIPGQLTGQSFMRDGHEDILWQHRKTGQVAIWHLRQTQFLNAVSSVQATGPTHVSVVAAADFNQDGHADLLWHNSQSGELILWLMRETNRLSLSQLPRIEPDFVSVGTGDFNADGFLDLLWRRHSPPTNVVWFMNGARFAEATASLASESDPHWHPAAVADFNWDGHADIVWRNNATGSNCVWLMQTTNLTSKAALPSEPDLNFRIAATGHFSPLPHVDLLWRHRNGTNRIWRMQGLQLLGSSDLPTVTDSEWSIAGTCGATNPPMLCAEASNDGLRLRQLARPPQLPPVQRQTIGEGTPILLSSRLPASGLPDSRALPAKLYQYRIGNDRILAGYRQPPILKRGRVLLLQDETLSRNNVLSWEIDRLATNLTGDGWGVKRLNAPRHDDRHWPQNPPRIRAVKQWIKEFYRQAPEDTNLVFLIGHVVIPYSGGSASDGHEGYTQGKVDEMNDHRGAWVADGFYGDIDDSLWTDNRTFVRNRLHPEMNNEPGDGKFDNDLFPSDLELAVGRLDFARLPFFERPPSKAPRLSETEMLIQYLRKDHLYRHHMLVFPERLIVGGFMAYDLINQQIYSTALRHGSRWFGLNPDSFILGDLFKTKAPCLWGFQTGHGGYQAIQGSDGVVHVASQLARPDEQPHVAFYVLQGSWFADWNLKTNNLLRCLLATQSGGLALIGYSSSGIRFHGESLGLGQPLGAALLQSASASKPGAERWLSLLGDPSLRPQTLPPPSNVHWDNRNPCLLAWDSALMPETTYSVSRSTNGLAGPWELLPPIPLATNSFSVPTPAPKSVLYQVRSLRLTHTGSGSFTNSSQGVFLPGL